MNEGVASVTEHLFSLEEPWQSRFLALMASRATGRAQDVEQLPTYSEVMILLSDPDLCRQIVQLLGTWHRT